MSLNVLWIFYTAGASQSPHQGRQQAVALGRCDYRPFGFSIIICLQTDWLHFGKRCNYNCFVNLASRLPMCIKTGVKLDKIAHKMFKKCLRLRSRPCWWGCDGWKEVKSLSYHSLTVTLHRMIQREKILHTPLHQVWRVGDNSSRL